MNGSPRSAWRTGLLFAILLCAACDFGRSVIEPDLDVPERLVLTVEGGSTTLTMAPGVSARLHVRYEDAHQQLVPLSRQPAFHSRNPAVVSVDPTGAILSEGPGLTYILAELAVGGRVLTDSVLITVNCRGSC